MMYSDNIEIVGININNQRLKDRYLNKNLTYVSNQVGKSNSTMFIDILNRAMKSFEEVTE